MAPPIRARSAIRCGCVRLLNHDIIDLYERVPVGSCTVVLSAA